MLGQHADELISESVKHFDFVSMTFNVDVMVKRGRKEVHRDVSIKCTFDIFNFACFLVKLCHFENVVLLATVLSEDKVIVLVDVKVHEVLTLDFRILNHLFLRNYLNTRILILHRLLVLSEQKRSIAEVV